MGLLIGGYWGFWRYQAKRFQALRPGVLYRVGQPSEFGLSYLVDSLGVKTVLSLQMFDCRLHRGWFDPGDADGPMESAYVREMGVRHLQWPLGDEAYWPWLTPWQFEEFYKLLDNPENLPVAVHCMGGRHRTGTFSALFRLEYDRWPIEQTLREMYSFGFGDPSLLQEHNLRTYWPRPRPAEEEWSALREALGSFAEPGHEDDFDAWLRGLIGQRRETAVLAAVRAYAEAGRPFALPLLLRLVESPEDPWAACAVNLARHALDQGAVARDLSAAASLIADFGSIDDQRSLLAALERGSREETVSVEYAALVVGATNRYTTNRIPYLQPLFDDQRQRPEPGAAMYRYCDSAVARLTSITDVEFFVGSPMPSKWDAARQVAREWLAAHPEAVPLGPLLSPQPKTLIQAQSETLLEEGPTRWKR